jgi:hypothetical protein
MPDVEDEIFALKKIKESVIIFKKKDYEKNYRNYINCPMFYKDVWTT